MLGFTCSQPSRKHCHEAEHAVIDKMGLNPADYEIGARIEKMHDFDPVSREQARHLAGGELDQIQFLLGHVSIQTTERYVGCKQRLRCAVNDRLGIEPDAE